MEKTPRHAGTLREIDEKLEKLLDEHKFVTKEDVKMNAEELRKYRESKIKHHHQYHSRLNHIPEDSGYDNSVEFVGSCLRLTNKGPFTQRNPRQTYYPKVIDKILRIIEGDEK